MEAKEIERKILTSYRKSIFRPFNKAIKDYGLIDAGDKICVCISGGKDSLILAKCMQEYERHGKVKISCEYVVMNPGYSKTNIEKIKKLTKDIGLDVKIIDTDIFENVKESKHKMPCYICAKMRRGWLYSIAKDLGCNKIALGHHFDDVIETTMLSFLYNGVFNTMLPVLDSENFEGMKLIRPLYLVREEDILNFVNNVQIKPIACKCPLKKENSKRLEVKKIIKDLKKNNRFVEYNIFKASENVDLSRIRGTFDKNK